MTTKDYCYDIITTEKDETKIRTLINKHLDSLFRNKKYKDISFDIDEKIPIDFGLSLSWKSRKQVCLDIKTRASLLKKRIKKILNSITNEDLVITKELKLLKPKEEVICDLNRFKKGKGEKRWNTLEHNGPYFKHLCEEPSKSLDVGIIYDGKKYSLNRKEEDVASFYAKRIITEEKSTKKYLDKKEFNDNFFKDFKTYLTSEHKKIFIIFKKLDFTPLVNKIKEEKEEKEEEKKNLKLQKEKDKKDKKEKDKKEDPLKKQERISKLEKKLNYSFAFVDGIKKDIRNSAVELPGLYVGSGNIMTNKGKIKQVYYPEDITINCTKGKEPIPPKGYKWGKIVHEDTGNWTAKYKDKTTGKDKYILLSETGDLLKFEKARKLNKFINIIDKNIDKLLSSKNIKDNQIGCALYLIKEYGIRVGNECEDDDCDASEKVVGATTLMVQNVKSCKINSDEYLIELSFSGKDSVLYENEITVSKKVYEYIKSYINKKKKDDKVFDQISSNDINFYLKSIDKDFSAKVFRTRLASSIMYNGLKDLEYDDDATDEQKIADFNNVNRKVAIKLNHKKGLTDKAKENLEKEKDKIKELKDKIKDEKDPKKKEKLKKEIQIKEAKLKEKDASKEIALDTSKKNYIDPRIVKAWAERVNLNHCKDEEEEDEEDEEDEDDEKVAKNCVDKVYTKAHIKHFRWAIEDTAFDENWDYNDEKLDCMVGEKLEPDNKDDKKESRLKEKLKDIKDTTKFKMCIEKVAKDFKISQKSVLKDLLN